MSRLTYEECTELETHFWVYCSNESDTTGGELALGIAIISAQLLIIGGIVYLLNRRKKSRDSN